MSANNLTPEFKANLILRGKIECLTGLHIGGSKEKMEIGGVDSIVVRSPRTDYPYIPGSSLKGKMRHLLEYITGAVGEPVLDISGEKTEEVVGKVSMRKDIVRMFGIGADIKEIANKEKELEKIKNEVHRKKLGGLRNIGLTRLIVRDALPDEETQSMWEGLGSDAHFTEYKAENTLDRLTSAANPRFIERVVEGSRFDFEMVYSVFSFREGDDHAAVANEDLRHILAGLRLLEAAAIGKSGSRGYGKIRFQMAPPLWVHREDYLSDKSEAWLASKEPMAEEGLKGLEDIAFEDLQYRAS